MLNYAKPDAESFGKVLDEKGSLFKGIELHNLYDEDASRVNILKNWMSWLVKSIRKMFYFLLCRPRQYG
jgi:hypothetical protein